MIPIKMFSISMQRLILIIMEWWWGVVQWWWGGVGVVVRSGAVV